MENQILDNSEELAIEEDLYDSIPEKFTTAEKWKKCTNLLCWVCDANFDTIPVFIPEYLIEKSPGNIIMRVLGNFCGFPCASQYNSTHSSGQHKWERDMLLRKLYYIFYGEEIALVPCSPPKTSMVQYGGFLTREQYDDTVALSLETHKKSAYANSMDSTEL
jgi:hypothetical protein